MTYYPASTDTRKGLTLTVFYNPKYRACSAQGLAERVEQVTVVEIRYADGRVVDMPRHAQVFEAKPEAPAVALVQRQIGRLVWHVQPIDEPGHKRWFMAGGSFVETSDSRISEITDGFYGAFSFHDRWEG